MASCMSFPETPLEFLKLCEFKDEKEIYTNGSMLIPTFRVEQMIEHYFNSTSTADVQEVIRCKDCIFGKYDDDLNMILCKRIYNLSDGENVYNDLNDFCSYGAKMDKE